MIFPTIEKWLKSNKMSTKELAAQMSVSVHTLRNNLNGSRMMSVITAYKLTKATGLTLEEIMRDTLINEDTNTFIVAKPVKIKKKKPVAVEVDESFTSHEPTPNKEELAEISRELGKMIVTKEKKGNKTFTRADLESLKNKKNLTKQELDAATNYAVNYIFGENGK